MDLQNFSKLAPEVQNAYLVRLFGEDAPARYAADIRVNTEVLGLLERQRDQLFTEDLVPDDPAKTRVQFAAFKRGLLESYERDVYPEKERENKRE